VIISIPYENAKLTMYPPWRVWLVHLFAKPLGVLVHVEGFPFGSARLLRREVNFSSGAGCVRSLRPED